MPFDIDSAKKEGYSDQEIASYLSKTRGFDYEGAVKEGYSDQQVIEHLRPKKTGFIEDVKSFGRGVKNIPKDLVDVGLGVATAVNPQNWPDIGQGIGKIVVGGIQKAMPGEPERTDAVQAAEEFWKTVDPGTVEGRRQLFEEHPVQTMGNLAFGAGLVSGAAKGAGKLTKSEALLKAGESAADAAAKVDPLNLLLKASHATKEAMVPRKLKAKLAEKAQHLPPFSGEEIRRRIGKQYEPGSEYGKAQMAKNIDEAAKLKAETGVDFSTAEEVFTPEAISMQQALAPRAGIGTEAALHEKNILSRSRLDSWLDGKLTAAPDGTIPAGNVDDVRKALTKQMDDAAAMLDRRDAWAARQVRAGKSKIDDLLVKVQGKAADTPMGASETLLKVKDELQKARKIQSDALYDAIPEVSIPSDSLSGGIDNLYKDLIDAGDDLAGQKGLSSIVRDIKKTIAPKAAETPTRLDIKGWMEQKAAISEPSIVTFQQLRAWRTRLDNDMRAIRSSATPDHNLLRRYNMVRDAVQSNMDDIARSGNAEAIDLYKAANQNYKDYIQDFRQGVTAEAFRRGPRGEAIAGKVEDIGQEYWKGGESSIEAFKRTFGDDKRALQSVRDVAIDDFIRTVPDPATGEISAKRLAQWQRQNKRAIEAYGLKDDFSSLGKAQKVLDNYVEGEKRIARSGDVERRVLDKSTGARALEALPEDTVRRALTGGQYKNMQERMGELIKATEGNPEALQGLKVSFRDFMKEELKGARDISGQQMGTNVKTDKVIAKYAPAIKALYGEDGVKSLLTYQKTLNRLNASKQVVFPVRGPATYSNIAGSEAIIKDIGQLKPLSKTNFVARALGNLINKFTEPNIQALMNEALINPEIAKTFNRAMTGVDKTEVTVRKLKWHAKTLGLFEAGKVSDVMEEQKQ